MVFKKLMHSDFSFQFLDETADVKSFDCDDADMNDFLQNDALRNQYNYVSKTKLAYYAGAKPLYDNDGRPYNGEILGFITLITDCIERKGVRRVKRDYPYPYYPAVKIARLGTNIRYQERGVGSALLMEGLLSAYAVYLSGVGCRLVTLDARNRPDVIDFYTKRGFVRAEVQPDGLNYNNDYTYLGAGYHDLDQPVPMYSNYIERLKLPVKQVAAAPTMPVK